MGSCAQSSSGYGVALVVDLAPSYRLLGLVLSVYAAAALPALLWPPLTAPARIAWLMAVGALFYRELTRLGWARPNTFVHRFGRRSDGHWYFEAGGNRYTRAILTDRLVGSGFCVLRLSTPRLARTLVVFSDATDKASHRRLRSALLAPQPSADGWKLPPPARR